MFLGWSCQQQRIYIELKSNAWLLWTLKAYEVMTFHMKASTQDMLVHWIGPLSFSCHFILLIIALFQQPWKNLYTPDIYCCVNMQNILTLKKICPEQNRTGENYSVACRHKGEKWVGNTSLSKGSRGTFQPTDKQGMKLLTKPTNTQARKQINYFTSILKTVLH